jgi:hypothetical protein
MRIESLNDRDGGGRQGLPKGSFRDILWSRREHGQRFLDSGNVDAEFIGQLRPPSG